MDGIKIPLINIGNEPPPSETPPSDQDSSPPPPPPQSASSPPPSPPPASPPPTVSPPPPESSPPPPPPPKSSPKSEESPPKSEESPPKSEESPPKSQESPPPPATTLSPPSEFVSPPLSDSSTSPVVSVTPPAQELTPASNSSSSPFPPPSKSSPHSLDSSPSAAPSPPPPPSSLTSSSSSSNAGFIIGGVICGILLILLIVVLVTCCSRKKKRKQYYMEPPPSQGDYFNGLNKWNSPPPPDHIVKLHQSGWGGSPPPPPANFSNEFSHVPGPMMQSPSPNMGLGHNQSSFSYEQLAAATNGFSQANLLGQGGFGYVHKGVLPNGKEVAVKSLKSGSGQGEREFQAEVEIISRVHHRHLVSLVGYCIADGQRMLVYEFVPNNTMEFHLHGKGQPTMDCQTRLRIALGSAKGLGYLHEDCHPRIIHRDIKAANILLDNNFEAMVADFGLAKLSSDNYTHVSTRVMGTFGYLAPEYASSGKLSEKSDVFSFGVMLLELITGRKPVDPSNMMEDSLVDWARPLLSRSLEEGNYDELVDPRLENNYLPHEMARMVACAAASIRHSARRRPKMSQIVRALEGDSSLDDLVDGPKPVQNSIHSSNGSSETSLYDTGAYNADMMKFRKMVMSKGNLASSEYEATSEYGINPSSSSSSSSSSSGSTDLGHSRMQRQEL